MFYLLYDFSVSTFNRGRAIAHLGQQYYPLKVHSLVITRNLKYLSKLVKDLLKNAPLFAQDAKCPTDAQRMFHLQYLLR